jgi:hypothetical protein
MIEMTKTTINVRPVILPPFNGVPYAIPSKISVADFAAEIFEIKESAKLQHDFQFCLFFIKRYLAER